MIEDWNDKHVENLDAQKPSQVGLLLLRLLSILLVLDR